MVYHAQLLRAIKEPYIIGYQLTKAEKVEGTAKHILILALFSLIIFGTSATLGIGNSTLSKQLAQVPGTEFETMKMWFAVGQLLFQFVATALYLFVPACIFWIFCDTYYVKLVNIQLIITAIYLLEKSITLPIQFILGLDANSSPFSLGIVAHYITDHPFILLIFAKVTIFQLWAMFFQYTFLQKLMERPKYVVLLIVIGTNVLIWLTSALNSYIDFDKIL